MKRILFLLLLLTCSTLPSQLPPLLRNEVDTNTFAPGTPGQFMAWGVPPFWATPPGAGGGISAAVASNIVSGMVSGGVHFTNSLSDPSEVGPYTGIASGVSLYVTNASGALQDISDFLASAITFYVPVTLPAGSTGPFDATGAGTTAALNATNPIPTWISNATNGLNGAVTTQIHNATNNPTLPSSVNATNAMWTSNQVAAVVVAATNSLWTSNQVAAVVTASTNPIPTWISNATNGLNGAVTTQIHNATNNPTLPSSVNATNAMWTSNQVSAVVGAATNGISASQIASTLGNTSVQVATTSSYISGAILTNQIYGSNISGRAVYPTNGWNGVSIDAGQPYQIFTTNASFNVLGFQNLVSGSQHLVSMTVSNSSSSVFSVVGSPTTWYPTNSLSTNQVTVYPGREAVISWWIRPGCRTNCVNASF